MLESDQGEIEVESRIATVVQRKAEEEEEISRKRRYREDLGCTRLYGPLSLTRLFLVKRRKKGTLKLDGWGKGGAKLL